MAVEMAKDAVEAEEDVDLKLLKVKMKKNQEVNLKLPTTTVKGKDILQKPKKKGLRG